MWFLNVHAKPAHARLILAATSLGFLVVVLDTTVVNLALERIQATFAAGVAGLQWVVNGYTLVFASLLLTAGALGDRLGAKRIVLAGFAIFTAASLICGVAPGLPALVAARMVQGIGGALLVPASLALLNQAYPDPAARANAVGIWTGVGGVALAAGPVVGGVLVDAAGWRSVFFINLPIGLAALWLIARFARETKRSAAGALDVAGQGLAIVALGTLVGALIEGPVIGWHAPIIIGGFAGAAAASLAFLAVEAHAASPMVPLRLFRTAAFSAATTSGLVLNFSVWGLMFVLSLFFQQARGYPPRLAGLAFLPATAVVALANLVGGRLVARFGPRGPMAGGQFVSALGCLALVAVGKDDAVWVQLLLIGLGAGLAVPSLTTSVLASVEQRQAGIATGLLNAIRQVGVAIGVAVFGAFIGAAGFPGGFHLVAAVAGAALLFGAAISLIGVR